MSAEASARRWFVEIVARGTGDLEHRIGPFASDRLAYKADAGVVRNLDHARFYTRVVEIA